METRFRRVSNRAPRNTKVPRNHHLHSMQNTLDRSNHNGNNTV